MAMADGLVPAAIAVPAARVPTVGSTAYGRAPVASAAYIVVAFGANVSALGVGWLTNGKPDSHEMPPSCATLKAKTWLFAASVA
jgi:hypothetical protein